jgi:hypothetical protein
MKESEVKIQKSAMVEESSKKAQARIHVGKFSYKKLDHLLKK